jgi:hypothetical protein
MNRLGLAILLATTVPALAEPVLPPTDAEKARWTMSDMRTLATAIEAYAIDHKTYPAGTTLSAVLAKLEPIYIRKAPSRDAWGHDFLYQCGQDGVSYMLVSVGSDGLADPATWASAGPLTEFDQDAVFSTGQFVRPWPFR